MCDHNSWWKIMSDFKLQWIEPIMVQFIIEIIKIIE